MTIIIKYIAYSRSNNHSKNSQSTGKITKKKKFNSLVARKDRRDLWSSLRVRVFQAKWLACLLRLQPASVAFSSLRANLWTDLQTAARHKIWVTKGCMGAGKPPELGCQANLLSLDFAGLISCCFAHYALKCTKIYYFQTKKLIAFPLTHTTSKWHHTMGVLTAVKM